MTIQAERYAEYRLWGDVVPFAEPDDSTKTEHFLESDDGIDRLTDVTVPSVTYYPVSGKGPHPAVIVCPGGGYGILAWNHEGIDLCSYFNSIGFSAFLLKYRCPDRRAAAHADCRGDASPITGRRITEKVSKSKKLKAIYIFRAVSKGCSPKLLYFIASIL